MTTHPISLETARIYLGQLDLSYIVQAMCSPAYALPRWNVTDATHCSQLYKNFLFLQKKHLPVSLVPTREIDEFWHNHILYTKSYFHDCQNIFGHYLHHEPAAADEDNQQLIQGYLRTKQFYLEEFGVTLDLIVKNKALN